MTGFFCGCDASTQRPQIEAAIARTLAMHQPQPMMRSVKVGATFTTRTIDVCGVCVREQGGEMDYPCPTVQALTAYDVIDAPTEPDDNVVDCGGEQA